LVTSRLFIPPSRGGDGTGHRIGSPDIASSASISTQPLGEILVHGDSRAKTCFRSSFGGQAFENCVRLQRPDSRHFAFATLQNSRGVCTLLFDGSAMDGEVCAPLVKKLAELPAFSFDVLRSGDVRSPEELAEILVQELDDRSRDILIRRYGLRGHVSETLEQIAEGYDVTRERIRQLESKALKKIALKGAKLTLRESLLGHGSEIWKSLVGEKLPEAF
jgi:hypothetical protein